MVVLTRTCGQSTGPQPPGASAPQMPLSPAVPGPKSPSTPSGHSSSPTGHATRLQPPHMPPAPSNHKLSPQGPRTTRLMSLSERPDDAGDAVREAVLDNWTLTVALPGEQQAVRVRPLLQAWDDALRASYHGAHDPALFGGSIVNYRLNPAWRAQRPADIDPLFIVPGGAQSCVHTLQTRAMTALTAVFADAGWPLPLVISHILDDDATTALVLMTLKSHNAHIDVRLAFDDSLAAAFDFRCNGLVCDLRQARRWGVLPGLDMKTVVEENNQGIYTQVRALKRDSIKRGTKMRMRGFVPGNAALDQALVPAFVAFLKAHPQADNKGFGLLFAEWLHRLLADYDSDASHSGNAGMGFLLNLTVQILQAEQLPQTPQMLTQLRRALSRYAQRDSLSPQTQCIVQALQTDVSTRALAACLDALATDTEQVLDASHVRKSFEVKRVEALGSTSLRVYLPDMGGYVVWPLGRDGRVQTQVQWPKQLTAQGSQAASAWLGDAALGALWDAAPRADSALNAACAIRLARLATIEAQEPKWALCLLWAAHCLDADIELDDAIANVLASAELCAAPHSVRQASLHLDSLHKQRGWQRLERLLVDPQSSAPSRQEAYRLARTWLALDACAPAALSCLRALSKLPTLAPEDTRGIRDMMQSVQPAALGAEALATVLGLWATSMQQPAWAPLQHALTRFAAHLPTCPPPVQQQVWRCCAMHLSEHCLWHITARLPHLFRASPPDVVCRWLETLAPEVLAAESVFMAQLLAALKPAAILDIFVRRHELVAQLLKTQTGYIAIGRLLAESTPSDKSIHIERMWLQTDAAFVASAALHVCNIMQPTHPLFLCAVGRALRQQSNLTGAAQIQLINKLWGKLRHIGPSHRVRMQRLVRTALMHISLRKLDTLPAGAWPKAQTLHQWAALFADGADADHMHILLICAFIANARGDATLVLNFMDQASRRRAEGALHMPALMALFYRAVALLADKPAEEISRAGAMLSRMMQDPNPQGSVWDHYCIATWRETARGLMRLGELTHSAAILTRLADGPFPAHARESIYKSGLTRDALLTSDTDAALRFALKNYEGDLTILNKWAGQLACELLEVSIKRFEQGRIDDAHLALDRALYLGVHRKPPNSFWRADPVFSALVRAFAKCPDPQIVQSFFDSLREADLRATLTPIDIRMLIRNRAIFEIAWVASTTNAAIARTRAFACLDSFGIDLNVTRPLAETLLDNVDEAEPLCLVVAQVAGALCYPSKTNPAEAQARLAWIIEGLSHAPAPMRPLYNLKQQILVYDAMASTKIGLHLTAMLSAAVDAKDWTRATALASLSLQFACAVVYETHTKHAINLIRATVVRLCQFPNAQWQSWQRLLKAVHVMADLSISNQAQHDSIEARDALRTSVAMLHKTTAVLGQRAVNADSDEIAVIDPPDPEALFKHAQFAVIMSELTDGPPVSCLRALMVRLSTMEDGLQETVELDRCASFMATIALQDENIQRDLLTSIHGVDKIDLRLLTRLIDGMRTWRPICEEGYACILEKAVHQRLKGENKPHWDHFLAHIFSAMRSDIREEETTYIKVVLMHIERFDSVTRRRNPWLVPFKQQLRAVLEEIAVMRGKAKLVMHEAQSLLS